MATITLRSIKGSPLTNNEVDTNFTNLNTDKYQSGDDVSVGTLAVAGETNFAISGTVSAAGTIQGDATALTKTYNIVTTATADQGVVLPDATTGKVATILNNTAVNIKVYPASGEQIDALGTNTAKNLAPGASLTLVCSSGTLWNGLQSVIVYDSTGSQLN
jgi:hypothetical protein